MEVAVAAAQGGVELVGRGREVGAQLREDVVRVAEAGAPHVVAGADVLCRSHDHDNGGHVARVYPLRNGITFQLSSVAD